MCNFISHLSFLSHSLVHFLFQRHRRFVSLERLPTYWILSYWHERIWVKHQSIRYSSGYQWPICLSWSNTYHSQFIQRTFVQVRQFYYLFYYHYLLIDFIRLLYPYEVIIVEQSSHNWASILEISKLNYVKSNRVKSKELLYSVSLKEWNQNHFVLLFVFQIPKVFIIRGPYTFCSICILHKYCIQYRYHWPWFWLYGDTLQSSKLYIVIQIDRVWLCLCLWWCFSSPF